MIAGLLCALALFTCNGSDGPAGTPGNLRLELVATGLSSPLYLTAPPGDTHRLFIVEQGGEIRIVQDGQLLATPFLDIRDRVASGGEEGLLSLAFHPNYATNHFFYVDYTHENAAGDTLYTLIERYTVSADPNVADPTTAKLILRIVQPYSNHNGGLVMFGPDGMLYIGMGDGGSGGDPQNRAQNPDSLLGKLRARPVRNPARQPLRNERRRGRDLGAGAAQPVAIRVRSDRRPALHRGCRPKCLGGGGR